MMTIIIGFGFSIERIIDIVGLSNKVVEPLFYATISVMICFTGIIGIIWSIIFGSLYVNYTNLIDIKISNISNEQIGSKKYNKLYAEIKTYKNEIKSLKHQGIFWIIFLFYFSFVVLVLSIIPLLYLINS